MARLTAEMALVLACCRWPRTTDRDGAIAAAAARSDWPQLLRLARRHRVEALVHRALGEAGVDAPAAEAAALREAAMRIGVRGLQLAAEAARLVATLQAAALPVLAIKGPSLAMLAYGTLGVKAAADIDLLVLPEDAAAASRVLAQAGYQCVIPGPDPAVQARWPAYSKESLWRHAVSGVHAELHTRLVDSPLVLPGLDARSPARPVAIAPGLVLPTLEEEALFAYLCVHGAASGWRRAKWLADVAALLSQGDGERIRRLHHASRRLGAGRAGGQALILCRDYLAVRVPDDLLAEVRRDRGTRLLAAMAARLMIAPDGYDDPAETRFGTVPLYLSLLLLLPGWRFRRTELARLFTPDPRAAPLPRGFGPPALLVRRLRRRELG